LFCIYNSHHPYLNSIPTRRSSDLISWHLTIIFAIYLLFSVFLLFKVTGNILPEIPIPPIMVLLLFVGILGYFDTKRKIEQIAQRSEEHTSELQSREKLVCRLLLEN